MAAAFFDNPGLQTVITARSSTSARSARGAIPCASESRVEFSLRPESGPDQRAESSNFFIAEPTGQN
ncbi:MAG: hypothetical protein ABFS23_11900, partial [Pseudomonadota bacterium]